MHKKVNLSIENLIWRDHVRTFREGLRTRALYNDSLMTLLCRVNIMLHKFSHRTVLPWNQARTGIRRSVHNYLDSESNAR